MSSALLPTDAKTRKATPITTGVIDYFPLALAEVARVSKAGNEQHNPGQPLHWAKDKSTDHADCISRHLIDRGTVDDDGQRHSAKLAWRALALLQIELEAAAKPAEPLVEKVRVTRADILFVYQVLNTVLAEVDTTPERFKLWKYAVNNREEFLTVLVPAATQETGIEEVLQWDIEPDTVAEEATPAYVDQDNEPEEGAVDPEDEKDYCWPDSPGIWSWGNDYYDYAYFGDQHDKNGYAILVSTRNTIEPEKVGSTYRPTWSAVAGGSGRGTDEDGNLLFVQRRAPWVKTADIENLSAEKVHEPFSEIMRKTANDDTAKNLRDSVTKGVNILSGEITQPQLNHVYFVLTNWLANNPR